MTSGHQNYENRDKSTPEDMRQRAIELHGLGMDLGRAWNTAWLEERIRQWPEGYGDDLQVVIYGDFERPKRELHFETLGITVLPENIKSEKSIFKSALTALKANVRVDEKSVPAIVDAARRIDILIGALFVVNWGNAPFGWWSWVTHGTGAGAMGLFDHQELAQTIEGVHGLPGPVRRKVESAFYWVREPKQLLTDFYRNELLRVYAGFWNAFECLVDAVGILKPQQKLTSSQKQERIDDFIRQRFGKLTPGDVQNLYRQVVDPGFVGKASHALRVCFPTEGDKYVFECFKAKDESLYEIRNAINHGELDAENPEVLIRIEEKQIRLWMIVWRMFGKIVPFSAPADRNQTEAEEKEVKGRPEKGSRA